MAELLRRYELWTIVRSDLDMFKLSLEPGGQNSKVISKSFHSCLSYCTDA